MLIVIKDNIIERKIKEAYFKDTSATKAIIKDNNTFCINNNKIIKF